MKFAKRMDNFGTGIFSVLAQMRKERIALGKEVIDLSVGAPNIPPADHILDALVNAAKDKKNYVYALSDLSDLQDAVAKWYKERYQVEINGQKEVCALLGSQEGLAHFALTLVDEGDIVLVPDPCYPVFADGPKIAGADIYYMPMKEENDYLIDFDEIPEEVAKKAKMMIVSYPNNPTSVMAPDWFYEKLIAFAKKYDIVVLHDNAYSELVFDGKNCGSFLRFEGAKEVGVEFNSLSKTYGLAGARVGFCIGNEEIVQAMITLKSNMDYGIFLPVQIAAIEAITADQKCVEVTRLAYQKRRDVLCEGLTAIGWTVEKSEATMFLWPEIPEGFENSEKFVLELFEKTGVLVTPGSAFGPSGEGHVRMALVQDEEAMKRAVKAVEQSGILKR